MRRGGAKVFYAGEKDQWECDFFTDATAIQVCAELTPYNRPREIWGLERACRLPGKGRALVLTLNQRDRLSEKESPWKSGQFGTGYCAKLRFEA